MDNALPVDLVVAFRALGIDPDNPADAADRDVVVEIGCRRAAALAERMAAAGLGPRLRLVRHDITGSGSVV